MLDSALVAEVLRREERNPDLAADVETVCAPLEEATQDRQDCIRETAIVSLGLVGQYVLRLVAAFPLKRLLGCPIMPPCCS